jgi:membrane protease YdiL (CAAX protease family)
MKPEIILIISAAVIFAGLTVSASFPERTLINLILVLALAGFLLLSREKISDFGLCSGDVSKGLKYSIILLTLALPLMLYGSTLESFRNYYPIWEPASLSIENLIIYEIAIGVMMLYTEFFYRGFLLFGLSKSEKYGKYANLIQSFIYMLMHAGKPGLEVPYSFIAGYVFGIIDLRCKSILPSFIIHFTGSLLFDLMILFLWNG